MSLLTSNGGFWGLLCRMKVFLLALRAGNRFALTHDLTLKCTGTGAGFLPQFLLLAKQYISPGPGGTSKQV